MSIQNILKSIALLFLLVGCAVDTYPPDWSPPRAGFFSLFTNSGCPDIQGTYEIKNDMWPVFGIVDRNYASKFDTVTITGDTRSEIKLHFEKTFSSVLARIEETHKRQLAKGNTKDTPESRFLERMKPQVRTAPPYDTMTDAEYEADLLNKFPAYKKESFEKTAHRGKSYNCDSGFLVELFASELSSAKSKTYKIGINKAGDLLRSGESVTEAYFSFWCGDHCDNSIRLPDVHTMWWDRKIAVSRPQPITPPWKVPFTPVAKPPTPKNPDDDIPKLSDTEFRQIITQHLPTAAILKHITDQTEKRSLQIEANSDSLISQFLANLHKDKRLHQAELVEITGSNRRIGTILIRK